MKPSEVQQIIETNTREEIVDMALKSGIDPETAWHMPSRELIDEIEARNEGFTSEPVETHKDLLQTQNRLDQYIAEAVEASTEEEIKAAERSYIQHCIDNRAPGVSIEAAEFDAHVDMGYVSGIVSARRQ